MSISVGFTYDVQHHAVKRFVLSPFMDILAKNMPWGFRRTYRKFARRLRRSYRKVSAPFRARYRPFARSVRSVPRSIAGGPNFFKRSAQYSLAYTGTGDYSQWFGFQWQNMSNYSDFTDLYAQVKVTSVLVEFFPAVTQYTENVDAFATTNVSAAPVMYVAFDPIDNTPWASMTGDGQVLEYTKRMQFSPYRRWRKRFYPTVLQSLSSGNNAVPTKKVWLNIGSNPTLYGIKVYVPYSGQGTGSFIGQFVFTWSVLFKTQI